MGSKSALDEEDLEQCPTHQIKLRLNHEDIMISTGLCFGKCMWRKSERLFIKEVHVLLLLFLTKYNSVFERHHLYRSGISK